ncbi:MAG: hypothetical protein AAB354_14055 [candidate division KSB1 bacterium]
MPVTLPLEIYETFEEKFGKTDAKKLVKSFEVVINDFSDYKWAVTRDELFGRLASKEEIHRLEVEISRVATKEELRRLATKEEINRFATKEEINLLATKEAISRLATKDEISRLATKEELMAFRTEVYELIGKLSERMTSLELKVENKLLQFDRKFTIMLVILFFTIIFLNQNALEFIYKMFWPMK